MQLVRWNPFRDLSDLENQMNRLFQSTPNYGPRESTFVNGWFPLADIHENDNELIVKMEIPGVDRKDVDVRIEDNVLTVRGERRVEENFQKEDHHQIERYYGTFSRTFALPVSVDSDKIHAEFKDGVLSIMLPKAEQSRSKKIEIDAAA